MKAIKLIIILLLPATLAAAQYRITGKVVNSADDLPLPGATVRIAGEERAVEITNTSGNFNLATSRPEVTLLVSFIGYRTANQVIKLPLKADLVIRLEPGTGTLQEVVVSTGYQQLPKERATGSFTKIDQKLFNQQVSTDVLSRLEGVANALSVDRRSNSPGIIIRGLSTIQGTTGPLIVLDNFPYEGDISNINPNDVESITILKDAAAASIWGTKAGNGVIVITTKKGRLNQPLSIEFNTNLVAGSKPDLSFSRQLPSAEFIDVETRLFAQGYYDAAIGDPSHPALSPVVESLLAARNGTITDRQAADRIGALRTRDVRRDFSNYIYRNLFNQQYALSLRGGTERMSWLTSGGYDHNTGNLSEKYSRANLHFANNIKLIKELELSAEVYFTRSVAKTGNNGYGSQPYILYPYEQLADDAGNPLPVARQYSRSYFQSIGNGKLLDWNYYPLNDYQKDRASLNVQDIIANLGLKYHVVKGLDANLLYQYERQQNSRLQEHAADSYFSRNLINSFTQFDASGSAIYKVPVGGIYDQNDATLTAQNVRGQLSYNNTWNKSSLSAIAGGEIRNARTTGSAARRYGVNENTLSTGIVDLTTAYPNLITGFPDYIPDINGLSELTNRYVSTFANAAYTYDDKYTISASARRDASNLFGASTNDKWTPLYSAGLAWNLSNERFYQSDLLPYLKLRATYGYSGNVDQSKSGVTVITFLSNSVYTGTPYARFLKYANPDLRWEKVRTINAGLDFRSKDNRVSGSVEYYRKDGKDLFGTAVLDQTAGIGSTIIKNVAAMKGNGFDIELNTINLKGPFQWTSNLNFSTYHDEITTYYRANLIGSNFIGTSLGNNISGLVGKPVYALLSYRFAGLDPLTGDPQGYLNGKVSKDYTAIASGTLAQDLAYSGPAMPTVFGSFGNTFTWRNISVTARLLYRFGYYFRKPSIDYNGLYGYGTGDIDYLNRWQQPGDEQHTNIPSATYPAQAERDAFYNGSEATVRKGDNIRLQYVNISYDLDRSAWKKLPFQKVTLYFNLANLGIIWRANKDRIDPDYPAGLPPPAKTYAFGIRTNF